MVRATIRLYLFFLFLMNFGMSFIFSNYVLFLRSHGLTLFEVNLVNLVFYATIFLCEIPTGAIADVFGRKLSFMCSCLFYSVGNFVYAISDSFWGFGLAEAIGAIGKTFMSGAFQAWLVDTLRHHGYTDSLDLILSQEEQTRSAGVIAGALLGSFLAEYDMTWPWIAGGCIIALNGMLAWWLMKEEYPTPAKAVVKIQKWQLFKNTVGTSAEYLRNTNHHIVRVAILMSALNFFAVQAPNMQWQPFFAGFLSSKISLGLIFAGVSTCFFVGAKIAPWFLRRCQGDNKKALSLSLIITGGGLLGAASLNTFPFIMSAFLIHEIARGIFRPLKDTCLQHHIPSAERATLSSFGSLAEHFGGSIGLIISGLLAEHVSIYCSWMLSGSVLTISALLLLKNHRP